MLKKNRGSSREGRDKEAIHSFTHSLTPSSSLLVARDTSLKKPENSLSPQEAHTSLGWVGREENTQNK